MYPTTGYPTPLLTSAPNLCRRPLGVLHAERVHGHRPRVHLQALFCPRQREALRHESTPAAPMCGWVSYTSRGKAIYIFSSGAGAAEPIRLGQRTQLYGSQESRVVIFAISVSSHPIEQHAAAVHWKNILLPRTLPSFFFHALTHVSSVEKLCWSGRGVCIVGSGALIL